MGREVCDGYCCFLKEKDREMERIRGDVIEGIETGREYGVGENEEIKVGEIDREGEKFLAIVFFYCSAR